MDYKEVYDEVIAMWEQERLNCLDRIAKLGAAIKTARAIEDPVDQVSIRPYRGGRYGPSLRHEVVRIVSQHPAGISTRQITNLLAQAGDPRILKMEKKDPVKPVRNALASASDEVYKLDDGRWRPRAYERGKEYNEQ